MTGVVLDYQDLIASLNSRQTVGPAVRTELSPLLSITDTTGSITLGVILLNLLWPIASRLIYELTLCWTQKWDIISDVVQSAAWLVSQILWKGQGSTPLHNLIHFFSHLAKRLQVAVFVVYYITTESVSQLRAISYNVEHLMNTSVFEMRGKHNFSVFQIVCNAQL